MPPTSTISTHLSPAELSYLHTSLSSHPPIRPDSRTATDFRPLNAETGVLPNTMGSAHVGFADGREAVVGVRAEVEKTSSRLFGADGEAEDIEMVDSEGQTAGTRSRGGGKAEWVTLGLTLPGMRDDDKDLVFLEEMLREVLVAPSVVSSGSVGSKQHNGTSPGAAKQPQSLQDALVINYKWHWHLYVDVLLISAPDQATSSSTSGGRSGSGNYSLPLLSMAIHLALRDTKLPRLKSEGDEDPVADDDWDASIYLYSRGEADSTSSKSGHLLAGLIPPVTLLVMVVAENVIFDPSATELAVADGVLAISLGRTSNPRSGGTVENTITMLAVRSLETSARDTMKGVPRENPGDNQNGSLGSGTDQVIPGVWKPKVGGIKRTVMMKAIKSIVTTGVGGEVLDGLDGFLGKS